MIQKMNKKSALFFLAAIMLVLSACHFGSGKGDGPQPQVVHIDSITIYCDEAFKYLLDQEQTIYEHEQPDKHVQLIYKSETDVLKALTTDSFAYAILGRGLHESERKDLLKKSNLPSEERPFASDAVALVANWKFEKDTLPYEEIQSLLESKSNKYKLVFEGNGSGTVSYMFAQIGHQAARPSAFAAGNMDELISYLQKDEKSIGFIPFVKISDTDDVAAKELLKKVKVLYVTKPDTSGRIITSIACQSDIADGSYPFIRHLYFVQHGLNDRVGTGFVNFLYQDRAGRIALKSGLIPVNMPQRIINVNTDSIVVK